MRDGVNVRTGGAVELRRAREDDWEGIAALLTSVSLPTAGAREHLDGFAVATRDGGIVGCSGIERYGDAGLLRSVAVSLAERGRGTAARLVEHCLSEASRAGITTIVLLTNTAERYFPRFGFERIARAEVPEAVLQSIEFREACCASAVVMRLVLPLSRPRDNAVE